MMICEETIVYPEIYNEKQINAVNYVLHVHSQLLIKYLMQAPNINLADAENDLRNFYTHFGANKSKFIEGLHRELRRYLMDVANYNVSAVTPEDISKIYRALQVYFKTNINGHNNVFDESFWETTMNQARYISNTTEQKYANTAIPSLITGILVEILNWIDRRDKEATAAGRCTTIEKICIV